MILPSKLQIKFYICFSIRFSLNSPGLTNFRWTIGQPWRSYLHRWWWQGTWNISRDNIRALGFMPHKYCKPLLLFIVYFFSASRSGSLVQKKWRHTYTVLPYHYHTGCSYVFWMGTHGSMRMYVTIGIFCFHFASVALLMLLMSSCLSGATICSTVE